jgi:Ca2+-binding EF-hand superfamily protein
LEAQWASEKLGCVVFSIGISMIVGFRIDQILRPAWYRACMKCVILPALVTAAFALTSYAGVEADELFDKADQNGDGRITRNDDKADQNGDGRITREEFIGLMIEQHLYWMDRNHEGTISEAEFLDGGGSKEDFRQIDVTGKGYFTVDEAKASAVTRKFWSLFDGPDKNGDGAITKAEFQESVIHSVKNAKSAPPTLGD